MDNNNCKINLIKIMIRLIIFKINTLNNNSKIKIIVLIINNKMVTSNIIKTTTNNPYKPHNSISKI